MNNYELLNQLYFKNESHYLLFADYLDKCSPKQDIGYIVYAYLASATEKKELLKYFDYDGIKTTKIKQIIQPYSSSEKMLIKLGLHLFNDKHKSDSIDDIFSYLDRDNKLVVLQSFMYKYRVDIRKTN